MDKIYFEKAFCEGSKKGRNNILTLLLKLKPDINILSFDGLGFKEACMHDHLSIVKLYCEHEPNLMNKIPKFDNIFELIVKYDYINVAEYLINKYQDKLKAHYLDIETVKNKLIVNDIIYTSYLEYYMGCCQKCNINKPTIITECEHYYCDLCFANKSSIIICNRCGILVNKFYKKHIS